MNTAGLLVLIGVILAGLSVVLGAPRGRARTANGYALYSDAVLGLAIALIGIGVLLGHPHVS